MRRLQAGCCINPKDSDWIVGSDDRLDSVSAVD